MVYNTIMKQELEMTGKKELLARMLSSFMFIPVIALIFVVPYWGFCVMCTMVYLIMAHEILSPGIRGYALLRFGALLFVFLGMASFVYCRKYFGPLGCGFLICITSLTDIGGYLVGKAIGGPRMCPQISPRKTWAGLVGGILLANTGIFLLKDAWCQVNNDGTCLASWASTFFVVQILIAASAVGDLLESTFKRKIKVKDVGHLLPGHGGLLDRLDSLLFASIVLVLMSMIIR